MWHLSLREGGRRTSPARTACAAVLAGSLALTACSTPQEVHQYIDRDRETRAEDAQRIAATLDAEQDEKVRRYIDAADEAVRDERTEALHGLRDRIIEVDTSNARQHAALRDALDRQKNEAANERRATLDRLNTLAGQVEGNNKALHSAEGVVRGMLFQAMGQLNQTTALAKDNERKLSLSDEDMELKIQRYAQKLDDANEARAKAFFARLEDGFWDFVQKFAGTAGVLAAILAALVSILYLWKKKGKTE